MIDGNEAFKGAVRSGTKAAPASGRDLSSAIERIKQAAEAIQAAERRATDMEERMRVLVEDTDRELGSAAMRIAKSEQQFRDAEARSATAEKRVQAAEEWLERLGTSLEGSFGNREPDALRR